MNPYQMGMPQAEASPYAMDDPDTMRQQQMAQFQAWMDALQQQSAGQGGSGGSGGGLMKKLLGKKQGSYGGTDSGAGLNYEQYSGGDFGGGFGGMA